MLFVSGSASSYNYTFVCISQGWPSSEYAQSFSFRYLAGLRIGRTFPTPRQSAACSIRTLHHTYQRGAVSSQKGQVSNIQQSVGILASQRPHHPSFLNCQHTKQSIINHAFPQSTITPATAITTPPTNGLRSVVTFSIQFVNRLNFTTFGKQISVISIVRPFWLRLQRPLAGLCK